MGRNSKTQRVRVLLAAVLALSLTACSRCGGDTEQGVDTPPAPEFTIPDTPQELSSRAAALVPESVAFFAAVRNPRSVIEGYAGVRPHLEAVLQGDLGIVETDLRNTLGIDLERATSLETSGVSPDAGFALAVVQGRLVGLVALTDADLFHSRLVEVAQARPFDLSEPLERREIHGEPVFVFSSASGPELAVTYRGGFAILLPDADEGVDEILTLALDPTDAPLSESATFVASVESAGDAHVHAFVNPATGADHRESELTGWLERNLPEGTAPSVVAERLRNAGGVTITATLGENTIDLRLIQTPRAQAIEGFADVTQAEGDPGFTALATEDVYAFVRLTLAPDRLLASIRGILNEERKASLDASVAELDALLAPETLEDLLPAMGSQAMLLFTRARLLTLSRAMNNGSPGEFFSGLGVVIAFELRDPAKARTALSRLTDLMEARATSFEDDGHLVVEFTDAQADIGNIVLTDQFALLVPARQRSEITELLAANARELSWLDVADARGLISSPVANGLFFDLQRISDGPIGQVAFARLPVQVRRLLGRTARLTASVENSETAIVTELHLRFASPATE